jgi:hypothetical protein
MFKSGSGIQDAKMLGSGSRIKHPRSPTLNWFKRSIGVIVTAETYSYIVSDQIKNFNGYTIQVTCPLKIFLVTCSLKNDMVKWFLLPVPKKIVTGHMFSLLPIQKIETVTPFSLHALQKLK